jgi:hypothetical protein
MRVDGSDTDLIHCSQFRVIPKWNRPNKWCLIADLSLHDGHSMNLSSLSYVSMEDVVTAGEGHTFSKS